MNNLFATNGAMQAQIDRLVAGELPEHDRRGVFAWLDEDGTRWRACAIAFLEAQSWEAAAQDWPAGEQAAAGPAHACRRREDRQRRSRWMQVLAGAAALLLVFAAGHSSGRMWRYAPPSPPADARLAAQPASLARDDGRLMASVTINTGLDPNLPGQLQVPVTTVSTDAPLAGAISDYERKQWEKHGFELQEELRYLPARLPDGSQVLVPINKVRVKLKSTPMS